MTAASGGATGGSRVTVSLMKSQMVEKYKKSRTIHYSKDFFSEAEKEELRKAGIECPRTSADSRADDAQLQERRQRAHKKLERAAAVDPPAKTTVVKEEISADALTAFLEAADAIGFHNFHMADSLPTSEQANFNRFLEANKQTIRLGTAAFADIPLRWLEQNGLIPAAFSNPKDYSRSMLEALKKMQYSLRIKEGERVSSNYWTWVSIFHALKMVARYKRSRAGGR
jgi:hypothetical protein